MKPSPVRLRKVKVDRTGAEVVVRLTCGDEYGAMLLYDRIEATAHQGRLSLSITVPPGSMARRSPASGRSAS